MSAQPNYLSVVGPVHSRRRLSFKEFEEFVYDHPELNVELAADGQLIIMPPASLDSSDSESEFITDIKLYARRKGGKAPSSAVGYRLPDGNVRCPDASYVHPDKLRQLPEGESKRLPRVVPDFVVEVKSPSDDLAELEDKMRHVWIANGVRLAWLVDVDADKLWIYRADHSVELVSPLEGSITGEDVLPGFEFDLGVLR